MTLTLESWIQRHRPVTSVPATLSEASPPRSTAVLAPKGPWLSLWERRNMTLAEYVGERMRGQGRERE